MKERISAEKVPVKLTVWTTASLKSAIVFSLRRSGASANP
jgi:hypothetical protein